MLVFRKNYLGKISIHFIMYSLTILVRKRNNAGCKMDYLSIFSKNMMNFALKWLPRELKKLAQGQIYYLESWFLVHSFLISIRTDLAYSSYEFFFSFCVTSWNMSKKQGVPKNVFWRDVLGKSKFPKNDWYVFLVKFD